MAAPIERFDRVLAFIHEHRGYIAAIAIATVVGLVYGALHRFEFRPVNGAVVRIDRLTGQVSLCQPQQITNGYVSEAQSGPMDCGGTSSTK